MVITFLHIPCYLFIAILLQNCIKILYDSASRVTKIQAFDANVFDVDICTWSVNDLLRLTIFEVLFKPWCVVTARSAYVRREVCYAYFAIVQYCHLIISVCFTFVAVEAKYECRFVLFTFFMRRWWGLREWTAGVHSKVPSDHPAISN